MFKRLREDVDSVMQRDPAARTRLSVILAYPGFHAILVYRAAHWLWRRGWHTLALWLSYMGRALTGIEIHPGAVIGRRVFIDHGMGVVIGETAEVGNDVTLYQGVTLGGTSLERGKRHPTLGDGVIVGAGAKLLGPLTVGANARVGSNAVVLQDLPEGVTAVGIPAKIVMPRNRVEPPKFVAYGTPCDGLPDPVARALNALSEEVAALRFRLAELEREVAPPAGNGAAHDGRTQDADRNRGDRHSRSARERLVP